ncbi:MAG: PKD domain-containing protein [Bacteroidota bacterium]
MKKTKTPSFPTRNFIVLFLFLLGHHLSVFGQDVTISILHVGTAGTATGKIITTMNQGDAPFEVTWTDPNNNPVEGEFTDSEGRVYKIKKLPAGTYQVQITDSNGCVAYGSANVLECPDGALPFADFSFDITGMYVDLSDLSTACENISSWSWDFGDGSPPSTEQNPSHTYQTPGTYTISLSITDAADNTDIHDQSIVITDSNPTVSIQGPSFGDIGESISLQANASGGDIISCPGYSYSWDLGSNASPSTATVRNPSVVYSDGGTKTVYVTVTDCNGEIGQDIHTIVIEQTTLMVDFTWTPPVNPNVGDLFISTVSGNVGAVNYQWSVSPNATIQNDNFNATMITFPTEGNYQVTLTACDQNGCETVTKNVVVGDGLIADFTGTPTQVDPFETVSFTNTTVTTSPVPTFFWQFGDGSTSTEENPTHEYSSPGCYDVSLTVTDGPNTDTEIKTCFIRVGVFELGGGIRIRDNCNAGEPFLVADITGGVVNTNADRSLLPNSPCFGGGYFPNGNTIPYQSYAWSSSDPNVSFTTGISPCTYITLNENHPPFAQAIANGDPITVPVKLIVQDWNAPAESIVINSFITLYQDLEVLGPDHITACPDQEVNLLPIPGVFGGQPPYTYLWHNTNFFLSGHDENSANPLIQVPQTGTNNIDLRYRVTVRDNRGNCVAEKVIQVTPEPLMAYAAAPGVDEIYACTGASRVQLGNGNQTAMGGSGSYTYRWIPNDGLDNPTIPNPTVTGLAGGQITYTLVVSDNHGCIAYDEITVIGSYSEPIADAGPDYTGVDDAICFGASARIGGNPTGSGSTVIGNLTYSWSADNKPFTSTAANPLLDETVNNAPITTIYTVTVVDDFNQCYDTDEVRVQVRPPWDYIGFEAGPNVDACVGMVAGSAFQSSTNEITPNPPMGATLPFDYEWDPPFLVDPNSPETNPLIIPTAEHSFATLTVTDANNCSASFKSTEWLLYESEPSIEIDLLTPVQDACLGQDLCFDISVDPNFLGWDNTIIPPFEITVSALLFHPASVPYGDPALALQLNLAERKYQGQICITPAEDGENTFIVDQVANVCGSSSASFPVQVTLPRQVLLNGTACNNNSNYLTPATYSAIHMQVAPNCQATVLPGQVYSVAAVGGTDVMIFPGFHAQNGSDFNARISDCLEELPGLVGKDPNAQSSRQAIPPNITLSVHPNPFSNLLTIQYRVEAKEGSQLQMQLVDASGRRIEQLMAPSFVERGQYSYELDGSQLAPGIYFIELINEQGKQVQRIVRIRNTR